MEDLWDTAGVLNAINNAPTVDINKLILIVARRSGKREMMLNALRPQGEWLSTGKDLKREHPYSARWYYCSYCGKVNDFNQMTNYCPNCGAKMKGGEEE